MFLCALRSGLIQKEQLNDGEIHLYLSLFNHHLKNYSVTDTIILSKRW